MTEPWGTILAVTALALFVAAGGILLLHAIRRREPALLVLCVALVIWPLAGEIINGLARRRALELLPGMHGAPLITWYSSSGPLITKVAMSVKSVQAVLALATALMVVKRLRREKDRQPKRRADADAPPRDHADVRAGFRLVWIQVMVS